MASYRWHSSIRDALVAEMRKDSNLSGDWDPETAVKHDLLYL